jgi:hypothetical protein
MKEISKLSNNVRGERSARTAHCANCAAAEQYVVWTFLDIGRKANNSREEAKGKVRSVSATD